MYLSECFQGSSSETWWPLRCWETTCRANSKKAAAISAGPRGITVVGGRGTLWTCLYYLRTCSGKWRTILCLPAMIRWSIVMSPRGRTSTERGDTFSGRVLVLWMDHGRKTKDGASLARVGSEAVRTCSEGSPTSYYSYASCPSRCGCCLLEVCSACRFPAA